MSWFRSIVVASTTAAMTAASSPVLAESPSATRMRRDINYLASDACEGRGVNTDGISLAADYIANQFKLAGLKPAGDQGTYFQHFTIPGTTLGSPNRLELTGPNQQHFILALHTDFEPLGMGGSGKISGPVVFAGHGITIVKDQAYDDYENLDVTGKAVLLLRDMPRSGKLAALDSARRNASLLTKLQNAQRHNAAAVLLVNDSGNAETADDLLVFGFTSAGGGSVKIPACQVRRDLAQRLLGDANLEDLERQMRTEAKPVSAPIPAWTVNLETTVNHDKLSVKNIVGVLEGSGPLADQTIVVGAHYDHLGYGGPGSLARLTRPAIHHGADDNGSGSTALMELARRFAGAPGHVGRRLLFMAFSGEERGLLGSRYYVNNPIYPLEQTAAMVNLDMVGRLRMDSKGPGQALLAMLTPGEAGEPPLIWSMAAARGDPRNQIRFRDQLTVWGTGTSPGFNGLIDQLNRRYDFDVKKIPGGQGPSDHASFYQKGVPVIFFFTNDHPDYHRPSDTADKINVAGMERVTDMVEQVVKRLDETTERPAYVKVKGASGDRASYGGMPRLGFQPGNYGETDGGVLVGGLVPGGAAARSGIKEGDRIVAIAGQPVANMENYMALMAAQKRGKPVDVGILRDGKTLTISASPD